MYFIICVCVHTCTHSQVLTVIFLSMEAKRQLLGVCSLLTCCGMEAGTQIKPFHCFPPIYILFGACVCVCICATWWLWGPDANIRESVLFLLPLCGFQRLKSNHQVWLKAPLTCWGILQVHYWILFFKIMYVFVDVYLHTCLWIPLEARGWYQIP